MMMSPTSPISPTRRGAVRRASMPHVVTQMEPGSLSEESYSARRSARLSRTPNDFLKPVAPLARKGRRKPSPALTILTAESEAWETPAFPCIRDDSNETYTPLSAVSAISAFESVFELPPTPQETPNSSIKSSNNSTSSFVAELEDTSDVRPPVTSHKVLPYRKPLASDTFMEFKTTELTSRAVLKVVDETIAAIEEKNRELLSRAEAAEEAAKLLKDQNSTLQSRIEECRQDHRLKTAVARASNTLPQPRKIRPRAQGKTPLSTFNATIDELLLDLVPHAQKQKYQPYRQHPTSQKAHPQVNTTTTITTTITTRPTPSTSTSNSHSNSQTLGLGLSPETFSHPRQAPQKPLYTNPNPNIKDVSSALPSHYDISSSTPLSSMTAKAKLISLSVEEAKKKPLPPLGPMSPSVVQGVVEIGVCEVRERDEWGRVIVPESEKENESVGRKRGKRGWSGVFGWKVKMKMIRDGEDDDEMPVMADDRENRSRSWDQKRWRRR